MEIGKSLFDENGSKIVHEIIETAKSRGVAIHLPTDFVIADKFSADANVTSHCVSTSHKNLDTSC